MWRTPPYAAAAAEVAAAAVAVGVRGALKMWRVCGDGDDAHGVVMLILRGRKGIDQVILRGHRRKDIVLQLR